MTATPVRRETLGPGEIHVWLAGYGQSVDASLHAAYRCLLNDSESAQEERFHFARDRQRYLVTRALVRTVLSQYAPSIEPGEWVFSTNAFGRPHVVNAAGRDLTFNISHTHGLVVLGVTKGRAIGVDAEHVTGRKASLEIAERFFAPVEVADLATVSPDERELRFFEYWTFKEAYIKARGIGLSLALDKFSFRYPDDETVVLAIDEEMADDPYRWQFWQLRPSADYLVAVCVERLGAEPRLEFRRTVPMCSVDRIQVDVPRVSAGRQRQGVCKGG